MQTVGTEDLKKVIALSDLPVEHLQWILDRAEYTEYEDGSLIMKTGEAAEMMMLIVDGRVSFYMDMNGRLVHFFNFENDNVTGGVGGILPYSRMKTSPGNAYAMGKVRSFRLHKKYFPELEQLNPDFIQRLIGYMTERARSFATTQLQHEKVNALGMLAAGIAHELNNPAAAINNIASELIKRLKLNYERTEKLLHYNISPQQIKTIHDIVRAKESEPVQKSKLSPLQRIEKEDEICDWLENAGFDDNREAGETFSELGFSAEDLESIRQNSGKEEFIQVIRWLENVLSSQRIIKDLEEASGRIFKLVTAIKSHVHMDRTNDAECTDIHNDLENTITLMGYKLREKNIKIEKKFCSDMPMVEAFVGELNQVWTNLIDNAIYVLDRNGELRIETSCDPKNVTVCIIDNGPGIPKEILSRIFDPFFTTKKVGEGSGIGLDTVKRIINRHNGEIKVSSVPGRTAFSVCIPVSHKSDKLDDRPLN